MIINRDKITITLEGEDIHVFCNVIAFALDFEHYYQRMTEAEKEMAIKLYNATKE